jgi:hypothetical protein
VRGKRGCRSADAGVVLAGYGAQNWTRARAVEATESDEDEDQDHEHGEEAEGVELLLARHGWLRVQHRRESLPLCLTPRAQTGRA